MAPITFPGLGFQVEVGRNVISIGNFSIAWYGLMITLGMVLAIWYCSKRAPQYGIKEGSIVDMMFVVLPIAILGARLYYVFFAWSHVMSGRNFGQQIIALFAVWEGGLAIYGGIIAGAAAAFMFCRHRKIEWREMFDIGALGLLIGQGVGRWGNFFNREVYGVETTLPWRMGIQVGGDVLEVHPLFLYESLWCLAGLILLHKLSKNRAYKGQTFLQYMAWYGAGRTFFELIRFETQVLTMGGMRVSMWLSLLIAVGGIAGLVYMHKRNKANVCEDTEENDASTDEIGGYD